jgi:hypothetical protein
VGRPAASDDRAFPNPPAGYHEREGHVNRTPSLRRSTKMYLPNSLWTWVFTLITLIQGVAVVGLEAYVGRRTGDSEG